MLKILKYFYFIPVKLLIVILLFLTGNLNDSISQTNDHATIHGTVKDIETEKPIENVNILIEGTNIGTTTDENGAYSLDNVPSGNQTVSFTHINYKAYSHTGKFTAGAEKQIDLSLESRAIILEEVEVVDTIPRRHTPGRVLGYSYDREEIERTGAVTFAQLIRSLVPQARVQESGGNLFISLRQRESIAQRYARTSTPYPLIIIDGMQIGTSPIGLSGILNPRDIERLEVIRPPESQTVYGNQAAYGAIVVETIDRSDEEELLSGTQKLLIASGLAGLILLINIIF